LKIRIFYTLGRLTCFINGIPFTSAKFRPEKLKNAKEISSAYLMLFKLILVGILKMRAEFFNKSSNIPTAEN
jgi:hypothetical protein